MPLSASQITFYQSALQEGRMAHLCIDNQAFHPITHSEGALRHAFLHACKNLAMFSDTLAPHMTSIQVMYHIGDDAEKKCRNKDHDNLYPHYQQQVFYDGKQLKAYPQAPSDKALPPRTVDLFNTSYQSQHLYIKHHLSAFTDTELQDFLLENGKEIVLVSGMYLSACVHGTLMDIKYNGLFHPVLIEDAVYDFSDACPAKEFVAYNHDLTRSQAMRWGIDTVRRKDILALCQP